MRFAEENRDVILSTYRANKSANYIAKLLDTYPNKILRALDYLGQDRRGYSEAQSIAIKSGASKHPTKGKKISDLTKEKIGKSVANAWDNISDEERLRRSEVSKKQWDAMSDSDKANLRSLAAEAVRNASVEGSKTEKFVRTGLTQAGWDVQFHIKDFAPNSRLEVDLLIPGLKVAIEIDGPSHFLPIWGEERLQKRQSEDKKKEGVLLYYGYVLIRVKQMEKTTSVTKQREVLTVILSRLEEIKEEFPPIGKRLIEIEV
jgi:very-short-patch-repair endonuclease